MALVGGSGVVIEANLLEVTNVGQNAAIVAVEGRRL
jgi:hypothetical protein